MGKVMRCLAMLLIAILLIGLQGGTTYASGSSFFPERFFAIITNIYTSDTAILEVASYGEDTRTVYTLPLQNTSTPREAFSAHEFAQLENAGLFPVEQFDAKSITQRLTQVWQVNASQLLAQVNTEFCYRVIDCWGYYEFLLIELASGDAVSLLTIDYHAQENENLGCPVGHQVFVDRVLPNPTQDSFVFTVKDSYGCSSNTALIYLIEFSEIPAQVIEMPLGENIAWSPDGSTLTYITRDNCEYMMCVMRIVNFDGGFGNKILTQIPLYYGADVFAVWLDSDTLIYQAKEGTTGSSEAGDAIFGHETAEGSYLLGIPPSGFLANQVWYLEDGMHESFVGRRQGAANTYDAFSVSPEFAIQETFSLEGIVYSNSRYNAYLFAVSLNPDEQGNGVHMVDAQLNLTSIDIAAILPQDYSLYSLAPGGSDND